MLKYLKYTFYILEHKWRVGVECFKEGLYIHAFTHDLSKFLPAEFFPYAKYFFGGKQNRAQFKHAVSIHKKRNKHHIDYWVDEDGNPTPIPEKYIRQLVCDWRAMGSKFKDTPREFYLKNKDHMNLHDESRKILESIII